MSVNLVACQLLKTISNCTEIMIAKDRYNLNQRLLNLNEGVLCMGQRLPLQTCCR